MGDLYRDPRAQEMMPPRHCRGGLFSFAGRQAREEMMRRTACTVVTAVLLLAVPPALAQQLEPRYFSTDDLLVVYLVEDNEYILPHLARCFINSLT